MQADKLPNYPIAPAGTGYKIRLPDGDIVGSTVVELIETLQRDVSPTSNFC
jgi:hypothetical protein